MWQSPGWTGWVTDDGVKGRRGVGGRPRSTLVGLEFLAVPGGQMVILKVLRRASACEERDRPS